MFWRSLLRRDRADQEWREEMEAHLQMLIDSFLEQGLTLEEARHAALKQAGNLTTRREEIYRMNGIQWVDSISGDIRYAARGLRKNLSFTTVAVLTLALGIGANTAVFSVVNSVLLKPLAFPRAEELVDVAQAAPGAGGIVSSRGGLGLSSSMYFTYTEQNRSFIGMAAIIGAFFAGLAFAEYSPRWNLRARVFSINEFLAPFFFFSMGARMNMSVFDSKLLVSAIVISLLAIVSKLVGCGLPVLHSGWRTAFKVGIGMVPRGEVGLIVALLGLQMFFQRASAA